MREKGVETETVEIDLDREEEEDRSRSRSRSRGRRLLEVAVDPRSLLADRGPLALESEDSIVRPANRLRREVLITPHGLNNTGKLVCFINAMLQVLWSVPAIVSRWLATTELNAWTQVLTRHIELNGDRAGAMTGHVVAYALLREWAPAGSGHDANEAFHFLLKQIPTIAPLFRIRQRQHIETPYRMASTVKTDTSIVIPLLTDGAMQNILPELERAEPTREDRTVLHRIETITPPPLCL